MGDKAPTTIERIETAFRQAQQDGCVVKTLYVSKDTLRNLMRHECYIATSFLMGEYARELVGGFGGARVIVDDNWHGETFELVTE